MKNIVDVNDNNFETEVKRSELPVLVDFSATWCGPCRMLTPVLENLAEEFVGRVKFAKVDVDQAPGLTSQFDITGVPALIVFRKGEPVQRTVGASSAKSLRGWLESATNESTSEAQAIQG